MQSNHVIATCEWQMQLYDKEMLTTSQNILSQWSNQVLPKVIATYFDKHCPSCEVWHIEQLTVDLGGFDSLQDFQQNVSQRFKEALDKAFLNIKRNHVDINESSIVVINNETQILDVIRHFLLYGHLPWWFTGNFEQALKLFFNDYPNQIAQLLRNIGVLEEVRKRIAWQWNDKLMILVVKALQPLHSSVILNYVSYLQSWQLTFVKSSNEYYTNIWYWTLTYLLKKNTSFQQTKYIHAVLSKMVARYDLSLNFLTNIIKQNDTQVELKTNQLELLITNLHQLNGVSYKENIQAIKNSPNEEVWQQLVDLLNNNTINYDKLDIPSIYKNKKIAQAFFQLYAVDDKRTISILKLEGKKQSVRKYLLQTFNKKQKYQLVNILVPNDGEFVIDYAEQVETLLEQENLKPMIIWEVILSYLLTHNTNSYFSRKQFVKQTLVNLSNEFNANYFSLLSLFISPPEPYIDFISIDLLLIVKDLHEEESKKTGSPLCLDYLQQDKEKQKVGIKNSPNQEVWQQLVDLLNNNTINYDKLDIPSIYKNKKIAQAFFQLYAVDDKRTISILKLEGKKQSVRKYLLQTFNKKQKYQLVNILVPNDGEFVIDYAEQVETLLEQENLKPIIIWEVILSYLLTNSYFSRKQFVKQTLVNLSNEFNANYFSLLSLFISPPESYTDFISIDLLLIVKDLYEEESKKTGSPLCLDYLQKDKEKQKVKNTQDTLNLTSTLLNDKLLALSQNNYLSMFLQTDITLLKKEITEIQAETISKRLAHLFHNLSDIHKLDTIYKRISKKHGKIINQLVTLIMHWYQQGKLKMVSTRFFADITHISIKTLLLCKQQFSEKKLFSLFLNIYLASYPSYAEKLINQLGFYSSLFLQQIDESYGMDLIVNQKIVTLLASHHSQSLMSQTNKIKADISNQPVTHTGQYSTKLQPKINNKDFIHQLVLITDKHGYHFFLDKWFKEKNFSNFFIEKLTQQDKNKLEYVFKKIENTSTKSAQLFILNGLFELLLNKVNASYLLQIFNRLKVISCLFIEYIPIELRKHENQIEICQQLNIFLSKALSKVNKKKYQSAKNYFRNEKIIMVFWEQLWLEFQTYFYRNKTIKNFKINMVNFLLAVIKKLVWQKNFFFYDVSVFLKKELVRKISKNQYLWFDVAKKLHLDFLNNNIKIVKDKNVTKTEKLKLSNHVNQTVQRDCIENELSEKIIINWLTNKNSQPSNGKQLLLNLLIYDTKRFESLIKPFSKNTNCINTLTQSLTLLTVIDAIHSHPFINKKIKANLSNIYKFLTKLHLSGHHWIAVETYMLTLLLNVWLRHNWQGRKYDTLIERLTWYLLENALTTEDRLVLLLKSENLPTQHISLTKNINISRQRVLNNKKETNTLRVEKMYNNENISSPISINNAGIVLLQAYIKPLFERLQLLENNTFISGYEKRKAVHSLQFLVTGKFVHDEYMLSLIKLLTGTPFCDSIEKKTLIKEHDQTIVNSLLNAAIAHWPAIGSSSIDGFRGNWLVRKGVLQNEGDHWHLVVEKKPYDILLTRAPFSYSIVNLPWMNKPIYVTWPI